jgi:hypothetical protein
MRVTAMSQIAAQHLHFSIPRENRIAGRDDAERKWPLCHALFLMAGLSLLAWAGIGLALASIIG